MTTSKIRGRIAAFLSDENKTLWRKTAFIALRVIRQYLICLTAVLIVEVLINRLF